MKRLSESTSWAYRTPQNIVLPYYDFQVCWIYYLGTVLFEVFLNISLVFRCYDLN